MTLSPSATGKTRSPKSVFRNVLIFLLGTAIGAGGALFAYSATMGDQVSELISLVNTQCNQDRTCISEVASGLEKAGNTLIQVAQSLRSQLSSMPAPTSPSTPAGSGDDIGCYYRTSDATTAEDSIFSDSIKTTRIENGGVWQGLYTSTVRCEQVTLRCNNKEITATNNAGASVNLSLESKWIPMTGMPSPTHPIYIPKYGTYLGESLANCQNSSEYRQLTGMTGGSTPTTNLVDGTSSTDSTIVSPNNPAVSSLPSWPGSGVTLVCPGDDTNKGSFYSSQYDCAQVSISCTETGKITSNFTANYGPLVDLVLDQTADGIYNSLRYPQYLGRNLLECRTALQHITALKNAGVYK